MAEILDPKGQALYEVHSLIGEGGLGSVYRVRFVSTGVEAAVKLLHPTHKGKEIHDVFLEEVRRIGRVQSHPGIVSVYDAGKDNLGAAHVAMEYVGGPNLAAHVEKQGPLRSRDVALLALGILEGLREAHDDRILHRNLSPSNVLLRPESGRLEPVISDLGFARAGYPFRATGTPYLFVTTSGHRFADPLYVAPECDVLDRWDVSSDLFSVGLLIHLMLTGKHPLGNDEAYRAWLLEDAPGERSLPLDAAVPEEWQHFLMKSLSVDPARRFASAEEMKRGLTPLLVPEAFPSRARRLLLSRVPKKRGVAAVPVATEPKVETGADPDRTVIDTPNRAATMAAADPQDDGHLPDPGPLAVTEVAPWAPDDRPERTVAMAPRARTRPVMLVIGAGAVAAFLLYAVLRWVIGDAGGAGEIAVPQGMVYFEEGKVVLGWPRPEENELAERPATVAPFFLDRREVTAREYHAAFPDEAAFWPEGWSGAPEGRDADLPVMQVTFEQAAEYARRVGKRLPTADEWERAARAGGGIYPWGSELREAAAGGLVPADSVTSDRTPEGVLHMAGNVSEWTGSPFRTPMGIQDDRMTIKGTSFDRFDARQARASFQTAMPPGSADPRVGFRCAKSAERAP